MSDPPPYPWIKALATAIAMLFLAPAFSQDGETTKPIEKPDLSAQRETDVSDLDAFPVVREEVGKGKFANALRLLLLQVATHENDPQYFNLVGILAMKAQDYQAAASALERVVIMQPDNAGAWLDLAIADVEIGNFISAQGYFDHIEDKFDPPPSIRKVVARYRAKIAGQQKAQAPWRFYIQAMGGVDSNANSGIQNSIIPLTFGGERIDLSLDSGYQPRRDNFAQIGTGGSYRRQFGIGRLEVAVGVRKRTFAAEHDFSTLELNLGASLQRPTLIGDASVSMQAEHLSLGGNALFRNFHAVAQLERPLGGCRIATSAEMEWRRYFSLTNLGGDVIWGQLGIGCEWTIADLKTQATVIGRIGEDTPVGNRPGGKTSRREIVAQVGIPLPLGVMSELSMTLATAQDAEGYSPLLENNAARRLLRRNVRLLFTAPFTSTADLILVAEHNRFSSNLALFQQSGKSISVGLKQRF